jgi:pheromone alpha factor receptor
MSSPAPQPPPEAFLTEQVINLTVWNGTAVTTVPLPLPFLTYMFHYGYSVCISYGTQLGACIVMLLVALTMTPRIKFARVTTLINIASLLVGIVRITLLATYFVGDSTDFYNLFSGDYRYVNPAETARNVAATSMAVPQLVLILAALIIQAWSMMKLWEPIYRWVAMAVSTVLAVVTLAFKITSTVIQARYIEHAIDDLDPYVWVRKVDLSMYATSIAWFCFMFNVRLIVHMWEHRKFLPSSKGLNPMEVLVMTNGILMLVPG